MMKQRARDLQDIIKIGRTRLRNAVPSSLRQESSGFAAQLDYGEKRICRALSVLRELAMGGTATGTGLNAYEEPAEDFCAEVCKMTARHFISTPNKMIHPSRQPARS